MSLSNLKDIAWRFARVIPEYDPDYVR